MQKKDTFKVGASTAGEKVGGKTATSPEAQADVLDEADAKLMNVSDLSPQILGTAQKINTMLVESKITQAEASAALGLIFCDVTVGMFSNPEDAKAFLGKVFEAFSINAELKFSQTH